VAVIPSDGAPPLADVVTDLLDALRPRIPAGPGAPVPDSGVSVVSLTERSVGIGNRRGNDERGPFPLIALKGGRLEAEVRFQLWAAGPADVDTAAQALQQTLLTDRDALRTAGFLRLDGAGTTPAEQQLFGPDAWRGTADYRVLYEYHWADTDGALGLIARIPIRIDGDLASETTTVTDHMALWDTHGAPDLEVRQGGHRTVTIRGLYVVSFLPVGWDGAQVELRSRSNGLLRQRTFTDVRALLAELTAGGDPVQLGTKTFETGRLDFAEPVTIARGSDFFRVHYADDRLNDAGADTEAALYLRAFA
jgi:hypothetical protein